MNKRTLPILLAFLCMGFGDVVGPIVGLAKDSFELTHFQAQMLAFMGFIMFGVLSVPVGLFQDRKGKKTVLMIGLAVAMAGMLIPLFGLSRYGMLLLTLLMLGAGASILQVAGNPIMRDVSLPGRYSRNLTIGQFIKAIGSLSGSLIPFAAAKWFGLDWFILFPIYSSVLLLTLVILGLTKIKEAPREGAAPASFSGCLKLLRLPVVRLMVAGIFLYVGAEITISSSVPILLSSRFGIDLQTYGLLGNAFFFFAILLGRFSGSLVLNWMKPATFFRATSLLSVAGLILLFLPHQGLVITGILLSGLGFANVFPLIFSITIDAMPQRSNEISGLMVTAIAGGALLPPIAGFTADHAGMVTSLLVPLLAMLYILYLSFGSKIRIQ